MKGFLVGAGIVILFLLVAIPVVGMLVSVWFGEIYPGGF